MTKWKDIPAEQRRLIEEVAGLVVMAIIVLFVFVIKPGQAPATKTTTTPPIQTNFNTTGLDQLKSQDQNYPTVNQNNLGRTDPFAPL
jgi:hypothetical protein